MTNTQEIVREAQAYVERGQRNDAKRVLREWLDRNPDDAEALMEYAWITYDESSIDDWRTTLSSEILQKSKNHKVRRKLAEAYYLIGDDRRAYKHFRSAIELNPHDWQALHGLASLYTADTVSLDEAEDLFLRALRIAPQEWEIFYNLCSLYARMKRYDDAKEMLSRALELAPDSKRDQVERRMGSLDDQADPL